MLKKSLSQGCWHVLAPFLFPPGDAASFFHMERFMETPKLVVQGVSKTFHSGRHALETLAAIDLTVEYG